MLIIKQTLHSVTLNKLTIAKSNTRTQNKQPFYWHETEHKMGKSTYTDIQAALHQ